MPSNRNIFNSMRLEALFWEAKHQPSCGVRRIKKIKKPVE
jgi:hypothetical protein